MTVMMANDIINHIYDGGKKPFAVRVQGTILYRDLAERISACVVRFDEAGLRHGARVMIVTSDEIAAVAMFLAAILDGKVATILSSDASPARLASLAAHFDPALTLSDRVEDTDASLSPADIVPAARTVFQRDAVGRRPSGNMTPDSLAYVLFTSGSTASPKGVMISHGALSVQLSELQALFDYGPKSRIFNSLNLSHTDGLIQGPILAAACGGAWLRPPAFVAAKIEDWINLVSAFNATHFLSVPTVYAMLNRLGAYDDYFDLPDLKILQSVGSMLPQSLLKRVESRFGKPMANHYGLTETVVSALYKVPGTPCTGTGNVGRGLSAETRILDTNGQPCAEGELWLKGPQIFDGYLSAPDLTNEVLQHGWLNTGDIARREKDGSFSITGRATTAINTGGLLVMPDEIDEALLAHPAVVESATVGLSDDVFGEIAVTAVVLSEPTDESALTAFCAAVLEPLKVPKRIVTVDAIPRGAVGKPQIEPLRNLITQRLQENVQSSRHQDHFDAVMSIAARVFRVPSNSLTMVSTPATVKRWDSFTHLSLVLEVEREFACRLSTSAISRIQNIGDLAQAIPVLKR